MTDPVESAIRLLGEHEPENGYIGCFSGGKDSVVIKHLVGLAGVKTEWHYHKTTIDPPELVKFIRQHHPDVIFDRPKHGNFFNRMVKKGFPTRINRWCCAEYKEGFEGPDDTLVMGIRAEESAKRASRWGLTSRHFRSQALVICPIYEWASDELWAFIRNQKIPYCSLYDEGFKRLGCIGCPMARKRGKLREFERWPQYEKKWKRAFRLIWEKRVGITQRDGREWFGSACFDNWEEMWNWWLYDLPLPDPKQLKLFQENR